MRGHGIVIHGAAIGSLLVTLVACTDVRDFEGTWTGTRVGDAAPLRVGLADRLDAELVIEQASLSTFRARLSTADGLFADAVIQPIPGAEADVLAHATFDGSPARVFMAFAQATDGGGDALAIVALYDDPRVEVRVLRGGTTPLYGIFLLDRSR
jgi:hypothetical protein